MLYSEAEVEERVTELLLAGLDEWLLSDCETESLEGLAAELGLLKLFRGGAKDG